MGKTKSRGNGEGTIYKHGNRWCVQVTTGTDPETGKLKRPTYYADTEKEAQEILRNIKNDIYDYQIEIDDTSTFKQFAMQWLKEMKPHIQPNTWSGYECHLRNHILPELGNEKLRDISRKDIQLFINDKMNNGRVYGNGDLSNRTIKYIHTTINVILNQAKKDRIIRYNPAENVKTPSGSNKEMNTYSKKQVKKLLIAAKGKPLYEPLFLVLNTGLRKGELLGLLWDSINFDDKTISVRRQLIKNRDTMKIELTNRLKSKSSKRKFHINDKVIEVLKKNKKKQNKYKALLGKKYSDNNFVFCHKNGKHHNPRTFLIQYKKIVKEAKLPPTTFHDLRHTFATLALEAKVEPKTIQKVLGHSTIVITMDTYSHVTEGMYKEASDTMAEIIDPV